MRPGGGLQLEVDMAPSALDGALGGDSIVGGRILLFHMYGIGDVSEYLAMDRQTENNYDNV